MTYDLSPVLLSVRVALISTVLNMIMGTILAWVTENKRFPGKNLLETVIGLPLVLPPTVIGFGLLLLFGKHGPLGYFLAEFLHIRVVFTWWAAVIAAAVVSLPLMYKSAKTGFASVDKNLEQAARTLGSSETRVFFTVTLPLAAPGVIAGLLLSFTRALGEFGATLMLAGNIPGQTQTIPLAIYFASEAGDTQTAVFLVIIISFISFLITYGLNSWVDGRSSILARKKGAEAYAGSGCKKSFT